MLQTLQFLDKKTGSSEAADKLVQNSQVVKATETHPDYIIINEEPKTEQDEIPI
jgi:hypothetical protein